VSSMVAVASNPSIALGLIFWKRPYRTVDVCTKRSCISVELLNYIQLFKGFSINLPVLTLALRLISGASS
jgi:hypothetical protein